MTIAESLKRFRKEFNLNQKQVAATLGIKQQSYQVYESKTIPSATVVLKLADAYDVSTDYLLGRSDEPRPPKFDVETLSLLRLMDKRYLASKWTEEKPNATTLKAIEEAERDENMYGPFGTVSEALEALNAPD